MKSEHCQLESAIILEDAGDMRYPGRFLAMSSLFLPELSTNLSISSALGEVRWKTAWFASLRYKSTYPAVLGLSTTNKSWSVVEAKPSAVVLNILELTVAASAAASALLASLVINVDSSGWAEGFLLCISIRPAAVPDASTSLGISASLCSTVLPLTVSTSFANTPTSKCMSSPKTLNLYEAGLA
ncbi:hypothetical protein BOX07_gp54 [Pseudoalteromonas phage PH1]|uniref:hypothetical protein n=1 Tax=Pseudoalteromonas phage PH1 TaxID=1874540 RepID=UPI00081996A5|nr:hypothetical protein BOX07_gp54 [Pseudoalteromonas phage PH1]ANY29565.1 hypothetical protein [Pseudoalteromonas phage PH1]